MMVVMIMVIMVMMMRTVSNWPIQLPQYCPPCTWGTNQLQGSLDSVMASMYYQCQCQCITNVVIMTTSYQPDIWWFNQSWQNYRGDIQCFPLKTKIPWVSPSCPPHFPVQQWNIDWKPDKTVDAKKAKRKQIQPIWNDSLLYISSDKEVPWKITRATQFMNTFPGATTFPGANAYICGIWDLGQQNIDSQKTYSLLEPTIWLWYLS